MSPSEHFKRHAAECASMAQVTRDPQSKAVWQGMAQRWSRCAELASQQYSSPQPRRKLKNRQPAERIESGAWA
jgi:hypothetical protein